MFIEERPKSAFHIEALNDLFRLNFSSPHMWASMIICPCICLSVHFIPFHFLQARMKIDAPFSPELNEMSSEGFRQLAGILEQEIMAVFDPSVPYVAAVQVISFKPGSIIALFRIIIDNETPAEEINIKQIQHALTQGIQSGVLDSIKMDPDNSLVSEG